jgi:di/tricarboxylate transporter
MAETAIAHWLADNIAMVSLIALTLGIIVSIWKDTNLGTLSLGLVLVIGYLMGGKAVKTLVGGYPTSLFLMLAGVMYLFAIAQVNGTLDKVVKLTVKSVKGNVAVLPIALFFLAFVLSSIGPGQISIGALMAAPVMALAAEVGIPPILMALVVGNGAQAGAMSPLSPNGIVGNGVLAKMGVTGWGMTMWLNMLVVHIVIAAIAYCLYGGLKLWKVQKKGEISALANIVVEPFDKKQVSTLVAIGILILCVVGGPFFKLTLDIGFVAFLLGSILILMKAADEKAAFKAISWGAIILVTGVATLVELMKNIGGMDLFAQIMSNFSTPFTVCLIVGFFAAIVSAYASTSGVIMPAFLPMAPLLLQNIGAPPEMLLALVSTIVVAGHLTDMSPLSTTGAVFISAAPDYIDRKPLFSGMMIWGLSMSVVGAVISWIMFGILGIP